MLYRVLKNARVVVSLVFFLLITFIFIDFSNSLSGRIIQGILYPQFIPSLIDFLALSGLAAAGFIFVILLTLVFGRVYCSTICPLGTLQDILIRIRQKIRPRKRFKKQPRFLLLRYGILLVSLLLLAFGLLTPLLLLDPYSNFGRIAANLFRPVYLWLNNTGALSLESMDIYTLYRVEPGITHWFSVSFSAGFFLIVAWLSVRYGRLFCNSLCPVGTLLGFISRFSFFRIRLDHSLCTSCGKCANVCKAGCIDVKNRKVDFSRCVMCFNCLGSCPSQGVLYRTRSRLPEKKTEVFDPSRRNLLAGSMIAATGLVPLALNAQGRRRQGGGQKGKGRGDHEPRPVVKEYPVSPPGSGSLEHFNDRCTACHLCVSACPSHVIKPAFLHYGLAGIMQPRLDYHASYCNFDCVVCTEVCPTGALRPISLEEKHTLQLGKVKFIKQNCIVFTDGTDCGACAEHCPTKAVSMRPFRGNLFLPEINPDICVGCGACEYACPTSPKSIFVEGNPVHEVADKPVIEALEQPDPEEDFPF